MKKIVVLLILIAAFMVYGLRQGLVSSGPLADVCYVVIPKGASSKQTAQVLAEAGVIRSSLMFRLFAKLQNLDKVLKAGEYQFAAGQSLQEVLEKISGGEVFLRKITFAEGLTSGQILYQIASAPDLSGEISIDVAEGELLPETYSYELGASRDSLVLQAKNAMQKAKAEAWAQRDEHLPIKNPQEMLVLASIIEKETAVAAERPVVASVFVNRLRKGMKLQTDPTVIYALTEGMFELGRSLKKADLKVDSPYNTYKYYGLPPGPICNPGKDALLAAVKPADTDFLYFVADGKGGHNFAVSLNEHNRNVRNWLKK